MTGYKAAAAGDVEAGPQDRMEVLVEKRSSAGWMWKTLGVLALLALCMGGARLYVWYQLERAEPTTRSRQTAAPLIMDPEETTGAHSMLQKMSRNAKAAIHLEGDYDEDGNAAAVEWKATVNNAFAQGGLRLQDNKIVIPRSGLYFVYSQAYFRVSGSEDGDQDPVSLSHTVRKSSESVGTEVTLLTAVRSACQNVSEEDKMSGRGCFSTIYLGAVFNLNKGDTLETETNHLRELDTEQGQTFFGAFAL